VGAGIAAKHFGGPFPLGTPGKSGIEGRHGSGQPGARRAGSARISA